MVLALLWLANIIYTGNLLMLCVIYVCKCYVYKHMGMCAYVHMCAYVCVHMCMCTYIHYISVLDTNILY